MIAATCAKGDGATPCVPLRHQSCSRSTSQSERKCRTFAGNLRRTVRASVMSASADSSRTSSPSHGSACSSRCLISQPPEMACSACRSVSRPRRSTIDDQASHQCIEAGASEHVGSTGETGAQHSGYPLLELTPITLHQCIGEIRFGFDAHRACCKIAPQGIQFVRSLVHHRSHHGR
jgi:hypothetical protein